MLLNRSQYARFMILSVFDGHTTDDTDIVSQALLKLENWAKTDSGIKNDKIWISDQFNNLYKHGHTSLNLTYSNKTCKFKAEILRDHAPLVTPNGLQELNLLRNNL